MAYGAVLSASLDQSQYLYTMISSGIQKEQVRLRCWTLVATLVAHSLVVQSDEMTMPGQEVSLK
jgi:hypothetical protein